MAKSRSFAPQPLGSASCTLDPSVPAFRPPQPHRVPAASWSQLLRCLLAPLEDLSCLPSLGPASPLQSPPCLTHTEPHALLISPWSQDGQGWCQGRLWALLRDLCGPWHILGHLFSCTRCLHGPSPLLSPGGWYFSGAPRTGRIKGGFVGGGTEGLRQASQGEGAGNNGDGRCGLRPQFPHAEDRGPGD